LIIDGVPVGRVLGPPPTRHVEVGSIQIVLATDAPLLADQLARLARRASLGLARTGSTSGPFSGDFTVAFSTAPAPPGRFVVHADLTKPAEITSVETIAGADLATLAVATVEAVEEAILDSLFRAVDVRGIDDVLVPALDLDATLALLRTHGRL
jgi:D-aminopeptidase